MDSITAKRAYSTLSMAIAFGAAAPVESHMIPNLPDVVDRVKPTVVHITCNNQDNKEDAAAPFMLPPAPKAPAVPGAPGVEAPPKPQLGTGTGIVIDSVKRHIVTNAHVAGKCKEIKVNMHDDDRRSVSAKLIGKDDLTDVAVLEIPAGKTLQQAVLGDSDKVRVGEDVFAIGHPFGLKYTLTVGVVSAMNRATMGKYDDLIQTDTPINPGNSGGPLFNAAGQVVGVNSSIYSNSGGSVGLGFAIPINQVMKVAAILIEKGEVDWGFMGAQITIPTEEAAQKAGRADLRGILIQGVEPGGPGEKAGVKAGDIVTAVNGKPVNEIMELTRAIGGTFAGNIAKVEVWREGSGGKPLIIDVRVGRRKQTTAIELPEPPKAPAPTPAPK